MWRCSRNGEIWSMLPIISSKIGFFLIRDFRSLFCKIFQYGELVDFDVFVICPAEFFPRSQGDIDNAYRLVRMTTPYVWTRIGFLFSSIVAVRTLESWELATLVHLMSGKSALKIVHAVASWTWVFSLALTILLHHWKLREHIWQTKKYKMDF